MSEERKKYEKNRFKKSVYWSSSVLFRNRHRNPADLQTDASGTHRHRTREIRQAFHHHVRIAVRFDLFFQENVNQDLVRVHSGEAFLVKGN